MLCGGCAAHLSRAVSCSNKKRDDEPQCDSVDLRVSNPTKEEMASKSASLNLDGAKASSSRLPESVLLGARLPASGVSCCISVGTDWSEDPAAGKYCFNKLCYRLRLFGTRFCDDLAMQSQNPNFTLDREISG